MMSSGPQGRFLLIALRPSRALMRCGTILIPCLNSIATRQKCSCYILISTKFRTNDVVEMVGLTEISANCTPKQDDI
jgi:hypothetical protein